MSLKNENGQILVVISSYFTEGQGRLWPAGHPFSLSFPWFNKIRAVNNMSIFERLKRRITANKDLEIVKPPDGGWGWVVCGAAFVTQFMVLGTMNNFGILYVDLFEAFGGSASKTCKSAFVILAFNGYIQYVHIIK